MIIDESTKSVREAVITASPYGGAAPLDGEKVTQSSEADTENDKGSGDKFKRDTFPSSFSFTNSKEEGEIVTRLRPNDF